MNRDLAQLRGNHFDVIIIGGGIYGVTAAWDAALRGLSVALIEKDDFGSATSSNSLKIIHGGLRYLQHADFKRMRESIGERKTLMRIAPHLVHPLPCIMPTYGHAIKGKEVMTLALFLNDLIGFDRNGLKDPGKFMPRGRVASKEECQRIIPGIDEAGLNGGAIWYDCQVHNSERLLLAFLHSAVNAGAIVANYVEMTDFNRDGNRVTGVKVRDKFTGESFDISADLVINNAGPWLNKVLQRLNGHLPKAEVEMSAAMNLVVRKKLFDKFAVGISSKAESKDDDALVNKGSRLFFVTPWKEYSLIGTTHVHYDGNPEKFRIREQDIQAFIDEVNHAYPPANLQREDVLFFYGGLLPMDDVNEDTGDVNLLKSYKIIDHSQQAGIDGLLSVVSVKYTTARDVAEKTVDRACIKLGKKAKCQTRTTPVHGGKIEHMENYLGAEVARQPDSFAKKSIEHLIQNYGSGYPAIVRYAEESEELKQPVSSTSPVLKAEVIYAVREEMAMKLADVVRRRTELGSSGNPGELALKTCARIMAAELNWDEQRVSAELAETRAIYVAQT